MPQIPNDTRWNSQVECLSTFLNNFNDYVDIMEKSIENESSLFTQNIIKILENREVYRKAQQLQKQLKLFAAALDKVSSSH